MSATASEGPPPVEPPAMPPDVPPLGAVTAALASMPIVERRRRAMRAA